MNQQGSPCYHNFLTVPPRYHSHVIPIDALHAEEVVEAGLPYVPLKEHDLQLDVFIPQRFRMQGGDKRLTKTRTLGLIDSTNQVAV